MIANDLLVHLGKIFSLLIWSVQVDELVQYNSKAPHIGCGIHRSEDARNRMRYKDLGCGILKTEYDHMSMSISPTHFSKSTHVPVIPVRAFVDC